MDMGPTLCLFIMAKAKTDFQGNLLSNGRLWSCSLLA